MSFIGDHLWAIVVIGGFVVLGGAIAFAKISNRVTPAQERRTEAATKELYREQSREDDATS